jgi:hypothetical protein
MGLLAEEERREWPKMAAPDAENLNEEMSNEAFSHERQRNIRGSRVGGKGYIDRRRYIDRHLGCSTMYTPFWN